MDANTVGTLSSKWMNISYGVLVIFSLVMCISYGRNSYRGIHAVCLLWVIIMPIIIWLSKGNFAYYSITILWPLLFELTYIFCLHYKGAVSSLRKIVIFIAIYGGYLFLMSRVDILHQTNTIYFVLLPLPFLLLGLTKKQQTTLLILFSVFALLSMKRSAMYSLAISWCFYFITVIKNRRGSQYMFGLSVVLAFGLFIGFEQIDKQLGGQITERLNRDEAGDEKGRMVIWTVTTDMIQHSSLINLIIGHGHMGVYKDSILDISAHNDFLEIIYDYGLIIFILYLGLCGHVIRRCVKLYRIRSPLFLPYGVSLSIFLVMSLVGHLVLYASYFNFLVLFWAAVEAIKDRNLLMVKENAIKQL